MKHRYWIIPIVTIMIAGLSYFVWTIHHYGTTTVPNAYAVWNTADLIIQYMESNNGAWPESWEQLEPIYVESYGLSFDELQQRVMIRWDVDIDRVRNLLEPPSDLIRLRDGGREHWGGAEPNQLIYDYLQDNEQAGLQPESR